MTPLRADRGAATVLAVGIIAAMLALMALLAPVVSAVIARQRVAVAAGATALAAADAARGILPGAPCELAASTASSNGVELAGCRLEGAVATVRVRTGFAGFELAWVATAGPPSSVADD